MSTSLQANHNADDLVHLNLGRERDFFDWLENNMRPRAKRKFEAEGWRQGERVNVKNELGTEESPWIIQGFDVGEFQLLPSGSIAKMMQIWKSTPLSEGALTPIIESGQCKVTFRVKLLNATNLRSRKELTFEEAQKRFSGPSEKIDPQEKARIVIGKMTAGVRELIWGH